ncbi:MAG: carboxypeptidase regulatory-like domain-containing protein [Kofleriaceae bacterium]|nr:carboxypeptidase regulatory-like domain-containing protein [Kofleriaceae bacterium]
MATRKTDSDLLPADAVERTGTIAPIRLASLALAAKLDAAKIRTLKLQRAHLVARYGEKAPELRRIDEVFDAYATAMQVATLDVQRARVPPVSPAADRAIVHGRVVDTENKGVKAATVTAQDAAGKTLATAKSDSAGYYHLDLAPPAEARPSKVSLHATATGGKAAHPGHELEIAPGVLAIVDVLLRD